MVYCERFVGLLCGVVCNWCGWGQIGVNVDFEVSMSE